MLDGYKKVMDTIKTDDEYKSEFLNQVNKKANAKKNFRFLPAFSKLATAAAVLLVVYCTSLFFIKMPEDASVKMSPDYETGMSSQKGGNVVYFTFEGFDNEGVTQPSSKAVLLYEFDSSYTLANLLNDYYQIIVGQDGKIDINDGMVDNFLNVQADSKKEINVYVNDREVMNLEKELVSDCLENEENVYFRVSVVE